jgi:hypothetical protein
MATPQEAFKAFVTQVTAVRGLQQVSNRTESLRRFVEIGEEVGIIKAGEFSIPEVEKLTGDLKVISEALTAAK